LAEKSENEDEYDKYEINYSVQRMNHGAHNFFGVKDKVRLHAAEIAIGRKRLT